MVSPRRPERVRVVNAPSGMKLDVQTTRSNDAEAVLVFARDRSELGEHAEPALEAACEHRLSWIAHPKAGQLGTDLNRDILWKLLEGKGVKPVRPIALDDVWSALRFRPA